MAALSSLPFVMKKGGDEVTLSVMDFENNIHLRMGTIKVNRMRGSCSKFLVPENVENRSPLMYCVKRDLKKRGMSDIRRGHFQIGRNKIKIMQMRESLFCINYKE